MNCRDHSHTTGRAMVPLIVYNDVFQMIYKFDQLA